MDTTLEQAKTVAQNWANANTAFGSFGTVESGVTKTDDNGMVIHHVVTMTNGSIIVSADDSVHPVLAASHDKNLANIPSGHPATELVTRVYNSEKAAVAARLSAKSNGSSANPLWVKYLRDPSKSLMAAPSGSVVYRVLDGWKNGALGESGNRELKYWNQSAPYWNLIAPLTSSHYYVGCGPVTVCHLMSFLRWPISFKAFQHPYQSYSKTGGGTTPFTGLAFVNNEWRTSNTGSLSDNMAAQVARNAGMYVGCTYGTGATGTASTAIMYGLRHNLDMPVCRCIGACAADGSDRGKYESSRSFYTTLDSRHFTKCIYNSIRANQLVILGIRGSDGAHFVSAVGYGKDSDDADMTYICCGWAGDGDSWFYLPTINTRSVPGNPGSFTYNMIREAIIQNVPVGADGTCRALPIVGTVTDNTTITGTGGNISVTMMNSYGAVLGRCKPESDGSFVMSVDPRMMDGAYIEVTKARDRGDGYAEIQSTILNVEAGVTVRTLSEITDEDDPYCETWDARYKGGSVPTEGDDYYKDYPHPAGTAGENFSGLFEINISNPTNIRVVPIPAD